MRATDLSKATNNLLEYQWLPVEGRDFEVRNESAISNGVVAESEIFYPVGAGAIPSVFERRLCNFLGPQTYVYPDPQGFVRSSHRVEDVAGPIFALRSDIAHGREIQEQFWKSKAEIYGTTQEFRQVLNDAALFLFCKFVQKVFLGDLAETLGSAKKWRAHLELATGGIVTSL